jgi:hypothetical protein
MTADEVGTIWRNPFPDDAPEERPMKMRAALVRGDVVGRLVIVYD